MKTTFKYVVYTSKTHKTIRELFLINFYFENSSEIELFSNEDYFQEISLILKINFYLLKG